MKNQTDVLGLREFLAKINLRDFGDMIGGELVLVGTSARLALASRSPKLPLALLMALVRLALLAMVVLLFGIGILIITAVRAAFRMFRSLLRRNTVADRAAR